MKVMTQKKIALLFVALLLFLSLVPAFFPVEDECLIKDSPVSRAYSQLYTAFNIPYDFDFRLGWIRRPLTCYISWYLPSVFYPSTENRAPPV
jgi:hypothetical protein